MFKQGKGQFLQLLLLNYIVTVFFTCSVSAQENANGFTKYNNRRLGPFSSYFHEAHLVSICGIDINYKEKLLGNLRPGMNYGLGIGYLFKIKIDDDPRSIGFGINAEYFPSRFHKINAGIETLGIGYGNDKWFVSIFSGYELNVIFQNDFANKEMAWTFYMAHIGFNNLDIKLGLQSDYDAILPNMDIDDTFTVIKLIYKFKF